MVNSRTRKADKGAQKMYDSYEAKVERERAKHLRDLQVGMISKAGRMPETKPPVYYVVSACMSALLIAATVWVIKWMLF